MNEPPTPAPSGVLEIEHWLRHMLGLPEFVWTDEKREPPYRNYAAVAHGNPLFTEMLAQGLVECYALPHGDNDYEYYRTTDKGRAAAFASVEHRKRSRSAAKYDRWLDVSDCLGITFGEYLKSRDPEIVAHRNGR